MTASKLPVYQGERVDLSVGDVKLYGYRVDGLEGYWHSHNQLCSAFSVHHEVLSTLCKKVNINLDSRKMVRLSATTVGVYDKVHSREVLSSQVTLVPTDTVSQIIVHLSARGNERATAVTVALVSETLTRRLDAAFGVHRSEADYQALTDALYFQLREKFRSEYIPKFRGYLDQEWKQLKRVPQGIRCKSHWQAHQVYALKRAVGIDERTKVDEYDYDSLIVYERALLDYDHFRRLKLTHGQALKNLVRRG